MAFVVGARGSLRTRSAREVRGIHFSNQNQMARKELNSDSESRPVARTQRARTAQQQAQQEYLSRHIHSNGPQDRILPDPLDFTAYSLTQLNRYVKRNNLNFLECDLLKSDILESQIGKKTLSKKRNRIGKLEKYELANQVRHHFVSVPVKENEIVTNFLYKVRNEEKQFKLQFK